MSYTPRILAFAGSLRTGSYNKQLVKIAMHGAEAAGAAVTCLDLREFPLPVYDGDLEEARGLPENARKLKEILLRHDGLLIASPEYNSSLTAALKNAIDWASRPLPSEAPLACFADKVAGIMSASPGALGGLRGLVHLRAILENIRVMVLPEQIAIVKAHEVFGADGALKDDGQRQTVEKIGASLARTLAKLRG